MLNAPRWPPLGWCGSAVIFFPVQCFEPEEWGLKWPYPGDFELQRLETILSKWRVPCRLQRKKTPYLVDFELQRLETTGFKAFPRRKKQNSLQT
eukprot:1270900-Amphidinium_carterae.1